MLAASLQEVPGVFLGARAMKFNSLLVLTLIGFVTFLSVTGGSGSNVAWAGKPPSPRMEPTAKSSAARLVTGPSTQINSAIAQGADGDDHIAAGFAQDAAAIELPVGVRHLRAEARPWFSSGKSVVRGPDYGLGSAELEDGASPAGFGRLYGHQRDM